MASKIEIGPDEFIVLREFPGVSYEQDDRKTDISQNRIRVIGEDKQAVQRAFFYLHRLLLENTGLDTTATVAPDKTIRGNFYGELYPLVEAKLIRD